MGWDGEERMGSGHGRRESALEGGVQKREMSGEERKLTSYFISSSTSLNPPPLPHTPAPNVIL